MMMRALSDEKTNFPGQLSYRAPGASGETVLASEERRVAVYSKPTLKTNSAISATQLNHSPPGPSLDVTAEDSGSLSWKEAVKRRFRLPSQMGTYEDSGWQSMSHSNLSIKIGDAVGIDGDRMAFTIEQEFCAVDFWCMRNSVFHIPSQRNSWSCGINASARFLAMLGRPVANYEVYHNDAPVHGLGALEVGPGPRRLYDHMCKENLEGCCVGKNQGAHWEEQESLLEASLRLRRPMLVLVEVGARKLHWVNLVGQHRRDPDHLLLLDSDDLFYTINRESLRQRMNLTDHIATSPFIVTDRVSAFNSISCTNGAIPSGEERRTMVNRQGETAKLRGNRSPFVNLLETVAETAVSFNHPAVDYSHVVMSLENKISKKVRSWMLPFMLLGLFGCPTGTRSMPDFSETVFGIASDCGDHAAGYLVSDDHPNAPTNDFYVEGQQSSAEAIRVKYSPPRRPSLERHFNMLVEIGEWACYFSRTPSLLDVSTTVIETQCHATNKGSCRARLNCQNERPSQYNEEPFFRTFHEYSCVSPENLMEAALEDAQAYELKIRDLEKEDTP